MRRPILAACLAALLPGCILALPTSATISPEASTPALYPLDPPPNIADGQELIVIPDAVVAAMAEPETMHLREATLQAVTEGRLVLTAPGRADAIRAHRIVTGMTVEEVILSIGSQPTNVRDQGPPGGQTLLWQPTGLLAAQRFWVRFDEWGHASSAGSH